MKSFVYAFHGFFETVRTQRNMRVHLCFAFYVILAGLVTALECLNTALESLSDTVHPEKCEGIRIAKDASAGAVLGAALIAAVVGGIVFFNGQKINAALEFFETQTALSILIILTLVPLVIFVRGRKREIK